MINSHKPEFIVLNFLWFSGFLLLLQKKGKSSSSKNMGKMSSYPIKRAYLACFYFTMNVYKKLENLNVSSIFHSNVCVSFLFIFRF